MPIFTQKHYNAIAKMIGKMPETDYMVETLTDIFGIFFQNDNEYFNFKRFQSAVTREREGQQ